MHFYMEFKFDVARVDVSVYCRFLKSGENFGQLDALSLPRGYGGTVLLLITLIGCRTDRTQ